MSTCQYLVFLNQLNKTIRNVDAYGIPSYWGKPSNFLIFCLQFSCPKLLATRLKNIDDKNLRWCWVIPYVKLMDKSTYLNVKTHGKIVTCLSIRAEASKLPFFSCLENLTYRCCKFWYYLDISQVDHTQIIWPYAHTNPEIKKVSFPFLLYLFCSSSSSSPKAQIPLCFQYGS